MSCDDYNDQLNALLDGELPPQQAAALAAHLAGCPGCTKSLAELAALRAGLAQLLPEADAPAELQARIEALLRADDSNVVEITAFKARPRWQSDRSWRPNRAGWIATAAAVAACLMLTPLPLLLHHSETPDLMSVHDAALRSASLTSNATVAAPTVPGFALTANHMDVVAGHVAQVAVYTRAGKTVILCIWPANGEPAHGVKTADYRGMAINYWNDGDHEYWAASVSPNADLKDFVAGLATSS
jgi:anti-sigma factor (TIGR02949 family)